MIPFARLKRARGIDDPWLKNVPDLFIAFDLRVKIFRKIKRKGKFPFEVLPMDDRRGRQIKMVKKASRLHHRLQLEPGSERKLSDETGLELEASPGADVVVSVVIGILISLDPSGPWTLRYVVES